MNTESKLRQRPPTSARELPSPLPDGLRRYKEAGDASLAHAFKGITTDGAIVPGLFPLQRTGVSTEPIRTAALAFLESLSPRQRATASFAIDSDAWRQWSNIHPFIMRHGVCLDEVTPAQRERGLALLRASLSAQGFDTARGVMKLNEVVKLLTDKPQEYGEWLYWVSLFGAPSSDAPWGWQLDGHHLIVNCFVLGDQIAMTPLFMGSEPVAVESGPYAGTRLFSREEGDGLALLRALSGEQRAKTILAQELPGELFTAAFRDNLELRAEGIRHDELSDDQQRRLRGLIELYVARIRPGHAEVRMEEVARHLAETRFAWMGGFDEDSVFYYRIHGPVVLIEFDHQRGIAFDNDEPSRHHIHTVIRTPNGNDYGKDLLRQHHARFDHARGEHRAHAETSRPR